MTRKPLYQHMCRDAAGLVIGTAYVYEKLDGDQQDAILKTTDRAIIRPYGEKTEVFFPN